MKTLIQKIALLFLLLVSPIAHASESEMSTDLSHFSVRIRPMGLAFGVLGAEFYYETNLGYFVGLTAHWFDETNTDKNTALTNEEYGIKIGKFFGEDPSLESGFWAQGALNLDHATVSSFVNRTRQNLSAVFNHPSYLLEVGYQFRATFIDPKRFNTKVGVGVGYQSQVSTEVIASDGRPTQIGILERLDPEIEFTFGYLL